MNNVFITGTITDLRYFRARNEPGIDIYFLDSSDLGKTYFKMTFYGETAKEMLYILKIGESIDVTGSIRTRIYENKNGIQRFETIVDNVKSIMIDNNGNSIMIYEKKLNEEEDNGLPF